MPLIPLNGMKAMATQNIAAVPNKTDIQIHSVMSNHFAT